MLSRRSTDSELAAAEKRRFDCCGLQQPQVHGFRFSVAIVRLYIEPDAHAFLQGKTAPLEGARVNNTSGPPSSDLMKP